MIVLESKRIMTSWANRTSLPIKKKDFAITSYYEPVSDNYAESTLSFLYSYIYSQRTASPFYIYDTKGFFQPLLKGSPILHFIKESPTGSNMATDMESIQKTIQNGNLTSLKRNIASIYQFNGATEGKLDSFFSNFGILKQTFDAGIVLDISGCVPNVINALKMLQKRTGKKTMKVFVMTDSMVMLKEFAGNGDKTWSYVSLLRNNPPKDSEYALLKTLAEIRILQGIEYLVVRFSTSLGKLLYLTSGLIQMESQIISVDGSSWKATN